MEAVQHQPSLGERVPVPSTTTGVRQQTISTALYPALTSNKPLLRVGVMLEDWEMPVWVADVLKSIQDSGAAVLTTVILSHETRPVKKYLAKDPKQTLSAKLSWFGTLLWDRYVRSDERRNPEFAAPFRPTDVHGLLAGAKVIDVLPISDGPAQRFDQADIALVKRNALDVIVCFGFNNLSRDILSIARFGVWSYHHGDNKKYRGGPAGFWEMYERNPLTGTILQILTEDPDGAQVIYRTYGATHSFESLVENRYWHYRKAIAFVARCLRKVYEHGMAGIRPETKAPAYTRGLYRTPRNRHMLLFFMRNKWMYFRDGIQNRLKVQRDHWFLGIALGVTPGQQLIGKVSPLHPPPGRFWADPMLVRRNSKTFMFFEDYEYKLGRAHISVVELDAKGRAGVPQTALKADYHLSYPFVFEWHGTHYMVPESASVNTVRLYRAVEFPSRWEYVQDLLTGIQATDATLCEHEGRWYLFTTVSEAGGSTWDELFLFMADTPLGPWSPHPMNPIVSDVRRARPGGALFTRDGVLYRPAQNSDQTYGHSIAVMEVTDLTPNRYDERLAYRIEPDWLPNIYGCHTLAMAGDLMVLDCKTLKWRAKVKAYDEVLFET
jgi:hypothetical protein